MNRKEFLVKAGLASAGISLLPSMAFGKDSLTNQKINLIEALKAYAEEHLELVLRKDFFADWSSDEDPHYYLYVSEPDKIEAPKEIKNHIPFGTDKAAAQAKQKEYIEKGKHTLLYSTEGDHDFKITNGLISNSNEGLAYLIFHEAAFQHFSKRTKLSYGLMEGACEVMGAFGAKFYAERNETVDLKKVKKMVKTIEKAYEVFNHTASKISSDQSLNDRLYSRLESKLFNDFNKCDTFIQQRFIHPVNNAYLLKNLLFARDYQLLKSVAEKDKFINTFLYTLENLPKKEEKAIEQLKAKAVKA